MKKILAFGTFDLLHPGHINCLNQAKSLGDKLYVCVARDVNVRKHKGKAPHWDENKRVEEIRKAYKDANITLGYKRNIYKCLTDVKPDIIALGYDQIVFTDKLEEALKERGLTETKIVRLKPFKPEKFKTSFCVKSKE